MLLVSTGALRVMQTVCHAMVADGQTDGQTADVEVEITREAAARSRQLADRKENSHTIGLGAKHDEI